MTLIDIPIIAIGLVLLAVVVRHIRGPSQADRAVAADLSFFSLLALVALFGVRLEQDAAFDVVLIGTVSGFVAILWLAHLITRGK